MLPAVGFTEVHVQCTGALWQQFEFVDLCDLTGGGAWDWGRVWLGL